MLYILKRITIIPVEAICVPSDRAVRCVEAFLHKGLEVCAIMNIYMYMSECIILIQSV